MANTTVRFGSDAKKTSGSAAQKVALKDAVLKYCIHDNLPSEAEKNVAIYTTDKHELYHGNGSGFPLSRITNATNVTKDYHFVMYDVRVGGIEPEIPFPYYGRVKKIILTPSSTTKLTARLIADLEVKRGTSWVQVERLYMNAGMDKLEVTGLDFAINNETLRINILDVQDDLDNIVACISVEC